MIDYSNEIFTRIANAVWAKHGKDAQVIGEYVATPKRFPCVTVDEMLNIPSQKDNQKEKYVDVTYRVQVFSNKERGKRAEARQIFQTVSDVMYELNLMGKTYTPLPEVYNSEIYQIKATFEATIKDDGTIYRR